jgi:hypothetical protein
MSTPLEAKKNSLIDTRLKNCSYFRGLVCSLQYLTLMHPNLSYSVNYVSQSMHVPNITHLKLVTCIMRYVKRTFKIGSHFTVNTSLNLYAFSYTN